MLSEDTLRAIDQSGFGVKTRMEFIWTLEEIQAWPVVPVEVEELRGRI